jgi:hypothetical protein
MSRRMHSHATQWRLATGVPTGGREEADKSELIQQQQFVTINKYYNIVYDSDGSIINVILYVISYNYVEYFFGSILNFWIL